MFVSETHLPQLLPPSAYKDAAWYERELERVLRPAWWAVALAGELKDFGHLSIRKFNSHFHGFSLLKSDPGRILCGF